MLHLRNITALALTAILCSSCSLFGRSSSATSAQPVKKIETTSPQPQKGSKDLTSAIAGEWVVTAIDGKALQTEENIPYINFVPEESRFYASNGCNILNGGYTLTEAGIITFGNVASTMKYCADVPYDTQINQALAEGRAIATKFENIGNESYLYLMADGKVLLTLRRANMEYLNGKWQVTAINGASVDDPEANIFFDVKEQKVHGNTGCNFFNGGIMFDPNVANSINFTAMGVTRMACPKGDQERKMLVALEETATVLRGTNDTIMLLDRNGKRLMTLHRVALTDSED